MRHALSFLRPLLAGATVHVDARRATLPWLRQTLAQLRGELGHRAPDPRVFEALVRELLMKGPESGWGLRNPIPESPQRTKWTPYYVPSRQQGDARAWLRAAKRLSAVLRSIVRLALDLRPTTPHFQSRDKDSGVQDAFRKEAPAWLRAAAARLGTSGALATT